MTNLQLLLTIGIPSLLVILSWLSNNTRLERADKRIDELDKRLTSSIGDLDRRLTSSMSDLDRRLSGRIDGIESRIDDLKVSGHRDALEILRSMTTLHERVAVVESKQTA